MSDKRPYVSFAEVKEKVTIPDVLQAFGIADRFTRKGNTFTGVCPFPSGLIPKRIMLQAS